MLLLFEGFVEIPPIFVRLHNAGDMGRRRLQRSGDRGMLDVR
jgi:hypothetical protein